MIWLHGMGEGGNDPDIAILGNEVSALTREDSVSFFGRGPDRRLCAGGPDGDILDE